MRTCRFSKLALAAMLSLALMLCLALTALADDLTVSIAQKDTVESIQKNIRDAINSSGDSGSVTITGNKSGANITLALDIPAGVTVVWKADYSGNADTLIQVDGAGAFEVAGGKISASRKDGIAIRAPISDKMVVVSVIATGGTVEVSGDGGIAIASDGDISVSGDAIVQATGASYVVSENSEAGAFAIKTESGNITVSGGTVSATGVGGWAIKTISGDVKISGDAKVQATGDTDYEYRHCPVYAIYSVEGDVAVSGGVVSTTGVGSYSIYAENGDVTVSGDAMVQATGDAFYYYSYLYISARAIFTVEGKVIVSGGTVSSTGSNGAAINSYGGDISIDGGRVETGGMGSSTICGFGNLNIAGGTVSASGEGGIAIHMLSDEMGGGNVNIAGGTVSANGEGGTAILINTDPEADNSNVEIGELTISGGTVTATGKEGVAISSFGKVIVNGGTVGGETAIYIGSGGIAAYLTGTCSGDFFVYDNQGLIVEVASLIAGTAGTSGGLTVKAGAVSAVWIDGGRIQFKLMAGIPIAGIPATTLLWGIHYKPMTPVHKPGELVEGKKTNNVLILNEVKTDFPAAKILDYNWLKLRDFAKLLSGTAKQFAVSYNEATRTINITTGNAYTPLGDELEGLTEEELTSIASSQRLLVDGVQINVAAYNIKGYNYLRLRELAIILNIGVIYDEETLEITLDLANPYREEVVK